MAEMKNRVTEKDVWADLNPILQFHFAASVNANVLQSFSDLIIGLSLTLKSTDHRGFIDASRGVGVDRT